MNRIRIFIAFVFLTLCGGLFGQNLPVYDSATIVQSFDTLRDIRFNTQVHKYGSATVAVKGIRLHNLYKAIKGKLKADGVIAQGFVDSIQVIQDSIFVWYSANSEVGRDTVHVTAHIPTLGGDLTGTLSNAQVVDNSHNHNHTTITTDIVSSINNVTNDGGNISLVGTGTLTVTPDDNANTITLNVPAPDTTFSYGDLGGGINSGVVRGLRGRAISATTPNDGQVYVYNQSALSWEPRSLAVQDTTFSYGDLSGGINSGVVRGLRGRPIVATAPTNGQVYRYSTVSSSWEPYTIPASDTTFSYGDLSGGINSGVVRGLRGRPISTTVPTNGQVYKFNGSEWVPTTITIPDTTLLGDVTGGLHSTVVADNSHSHNYTTITTDIVSSINGVSNDGGNIGLVGDSYINVISNNTTDTIQLQLDASGLSRPYRVYTALMVLKDTLDPTVTVLENTLGGSITWVRSTAGVFLGSYVGGFSESRTTVQTNMGVILSGGVTSAVTEGYCVSDDAVRLNVRNYSGTLTDIVAAKIFVEIRVYNAP